MKPWAVLLMVFAGVFGLAQSGDRAILECCRLVFQGLRPQFAYAERTLPKRFFVAGGAGERWFAYSSHHRKH